MMSEPALSGGSRRNKDMCLISVAQALSKISGYNDVGEFRSVDGPFIPGTDVLAQLHRITSSVSKLPHELDFLKLCKQAKVHDSLFLNDDSKKKYRNLKDYKPPRPGNHPHSDGSSGPSPPPTPPPTPPPPSDKPQPPPSSSPSAQDPPYYTPPSTPDLPYFTPPSSPGNGDIPTHEDNHDDTTTPKQVNTDIDHDDSTKPSKTQDLEPSPIKKLKPFLSNIKNAITYLVPSPRSILPPRNKPAIEYSEPMTPQSVVPFPARENTIPKSFIPYQPPEPTSTTRRLPHESVTNPRQNILALPPIDHPPPPLEPRIAISLNDNIETDSDEDRISSNRWSEVDSNAIRSQRTVRRLSPPVIWKLPDSAYANIPSSYESRDLDRERRERVRNKKPKPYNRPQVDDIRVINEKPAAIASPPTATEKVVQPTERVNINPHEGRVRYKKKSKPYDRPETDEIRVINDTPAVLSSAQVIADQPDPEIPPDVVLDQGTRSEKRKIDKPVVRYDIKRIRKKPEKRSRRLNPDDSPPRSPLRLPSIFGSSTSMNANSGSTSTLQLSDSEAEQEPESRKRFREWTDKRDPNFRWKWVFKGKKRKPTFRGFYDDYIPLPKLERNWSVPRLNQLTEQNMPW